jgi:hypothetical protein
MLPRRVRVLVFSVFVFFALCSAVRAAPAEGEDSSLVILIDPGSPALTRRLEEEIETLELSVRVMREIDPNQSLESLARGANAVAAIRVTQAGSGVVEMTIVDRATGKIVSRRLSIATPADPASAELVATRTVELLRASLMELSAPHPARGDAPITPELESLAPPPVDAGPRASRSTSRLSLSLGPALVFSPNLGSTADAWLGLTWIGAHRVGLSVQGLVPLESHRLDAAEGRIEVSASIYRIAGVLRVPLGWNPLSGHLLAGAMLARVTTRGDASAPFVGEEEEHVLAGPWIGARLELELSSFFAVFLAADAGLSFPQTVIRSAGRELTSYGRPLVSGSAGVALLWD